MESYNKENYRPGFWALMGVMAQGAFSDNVLKWSIIYLLMGAVATVATDNDVAELAKITGFATMLFSLPYILFPGIFGVLSDRLSKKSIVSMTKIVEVVIMTVGLFAFLSGQAIFLWVVLFLMATQSAMFSPAKYGILPEALPESRLSWGNGMMQMFTMLAIIAGTGVTGIVYKKLAANGNVHYISFFLIGLAGIGYVCSRFVFSPPAANPDRESTLNPWAGMKETFKCYSADRWLWLSVLAYVYFWFMAALLNAVIPVFGKDTLGLGPDRISYLLAAVSIGIALGAVFAGYASRGKIEVGLIPLGALGMAVFSGLLASPLSGFNGILMLLVGLGFFAGVYDVPLAATIQQRSPANKRGVIMSITNMLTFVGMFFAGALMIGFGKIGLPPRIVFLIAGVMSLGVGLYICFILPVFLLRLVLWFLANTIYRLRAVGRSNIPETGGALLVANHTSFLDALIIIASIDRRVRFVMYKGIYDIPWIKPLAKMVGAIPIMPGSGQKDINQSLHAATDAINEGDLVCIFAEGQITRTGQMLPFRKGFERIMKGTDDAPIIPVYIDRIWGSIFSFSESKFFWKMPRKIPFPITIAYGKPMPSDRNAYELRNAIQELGTVAHEQRAKKQPLLHHMFIRKARRMPTKPCVADGRSGALNHLKTLAGSVAFARKLNETLRDEKMVGILLPQSVGGTLANVAIQMMGKVPVNLNYTASNEALQMAADQCEMKYVITSKAFLEQVPVTVPGETIFAEDIRESIGSKERIIGMLMGFLLPIKMLDKILGGDRKRSVEDLATIVFSSGSEGEPKGVMLTQYNIIRNAEASLQVFPHQPGDCIMGMLPFFHSFGFTATLWLPLIHPNFNAAYHPNPLEAKQIGQIIEKYKATILFSTSTFLQPFIRRCSPKQLSTLRFIVTGAEKLSPRVRDAFKDKFGVEPLEGYGTTECAPVVSLNVPDFRAPGFFQKGTKQGSIGHPLPGISVRIMDPDTRDVLQNGEAGLLMVKGPNIMKGYLNNPEKTDEVLKDGWYETGDIATIDEDGFITITDRLARFSKIAGEMVSHTKIETALQDLLEDSELALAVAGVPDETKGERLIVLHTLSDDDFEMLIDNLDQTGLPNLWIPKPKAFYRVDEIPVLGTGKMDIKQVKQMARQLDIGE
jgi:acyl-[acyl-carrier-protein]-phospholipid O-acyltransferase/long-chain-fatty-acid--[acyl-carrier-protein] ligase